MGPQLVMLREGKFHKGLRYWKRDEAYFTKLLCDKTIRDRMAFYREQRDTSNMTIDSFGIGFDMFSELHKTMVNKVTFVGFRRAILRHCLEGINIFILFETSQKPLILDVYITTSRVETSSAFPVHFTSNRKNSSQQTKLNLLL